MFELEPTPDAASWRLPVTRAMSVGAADYPFMFGGIGFGAALIAAERTLGRPVAWATAQFHAHAAPGEIVDLRVAVTAAGKSSTQATVTASVGDRPVYSIAAALGARDHPLSAQWVRAPAVPGPDGTTGAFAWPATGLELREGLEVRVAPIDDARAPDERRYALWMRSRQGRPLDVGLLAVYGDFVSAAIEIALGPSWKAGSLDNTIRVHRIVPAEWVLCEITLLGAHAGIVQGDMRMFTAEGQLVATASQSMLLRFYG